MIREARAELEAAAIGTGPELGIDVLKPVIRHATLDQRHEVDAHAGRGVLPRSPPAPRGRSWCVAGR